MTEEEIKINFSKNVRELRISRKLNQIQLGEKIHYSSKAISKWENADVLPDIVTLKMLADFFNITVDDLISNKNVVIRSHRGLNRGLITASSMLLSFVIAAVMFMILYYCHVDGAWKAFPVALVTASITFVVFTSLWYTRVILNISIALLIGSIALMVMCFLDFYLFWVIMIVGAALIAASITFFNIRFTNRK